MGDLGEAETAGLLSLGCQGPGSEPRGLLIPNLKLVLNARRGETTSLDNLQAQSSTLNMKIFRA